MYRSPFTILPALESGPLPARADLLLERRKLQAEFELQGADSIRVNGHELHRQDVTALFDELQEEDSLAFHRAVSAQPALRVFLEHAFVGEGAQWQSGPLEAWAEKLSPLFAAAQDVFHKELITGEAPVEALHRYEQQPKLFLPQDTETAYRSAARLLLEKKNYLLQLQSRARGGAGTVGAVEIGRWASPGQVALINALPDEFSQLRYGIADALNNLCVVFDKAKNHKLALRAIEAAAAIRLEGGELRSLIPRNLDLLRRRRSNFVQRYWWVVVLVVVVIRIFLALSGSRSTGPSDNIRRLFEDRQNSVSIEPGTVPETGNDHRSQTLASMVRAMNTPQSSSTDTRRTLPYQVRAPQSAGDDPFHPIFTGFNEASLEKPDMALRELGVKNNSRWGFILFGQVGDGLLTRSWYLPPGSSISVSVPAEGNYRLYGCAGNDWYSGKVQPFDYYSPAQSPTRAQLLGGFTKLPANAADLLPNGLLDRQLNLGRTQTDTLILEDAPSRKNRIRLRTVHRAPPGESV